MILSRVWYVLLGVAVAVALYVVFVAVGQYNRQSARALKEGLASDSQTVEWALKIDARRRLDALIVGSLDGTLQQALVAANAGREGKMAEKPKAEAKKALLSISEAIPADLRSDALFAVDRDGHVIAELGYDAVIGNDDFELGGYPAVNDALHGYIRDDVWELGSRLFVVVARPVEYDATQRPPGAVVGLKEVSKKFVEDLARRTRTSLAFFASDKTVATGIGVDGLDPERLDAIGNDLKDVSDKTYGEAGRSEARMLSDDFGVMYARLAGDALSVGGGFAVARARTVLTGPLGFLSTADDKDKANVPWLLLAGVVLFAAVVGIWFTLIEHSAPLGELVMQADRLKAGAMEHLQVARFRGAYRLAAQAINEGLERAIEKAGGVTRKPADLESILGPTPAQPAMAAFSFPQGEEADVPSVPSAVGRSNTGSITRPNPVPHVPTAVAAPAPAPLLPPPAPPPRPPNARPLSGLPTSFMGEDDDATMVGSVPADILAQATGEGRIAAEEMGEWLSVYDDFVRMKRQCGEPVDGLTFEKFSHTLKKNRDQLVSRHAVRRVKFSVYVKEGRASLKATPVRE